ncbi:MAG: hypothetical protein AAB403_16280 [Planctomycetota bacterium]
MDWKTICWAFPQGGPAVRATEDNEMARCWRLRREGRAAVAKLLYLG